MYYVLQGSCSTKLRAGVSGGEAPWVSCGFGEAHGSAPFARLPALKVYWVNKKLPDFESWLLHGP